MVMVLNFKNKFKNYEFNNLKKKYLPYAMHVLSLYLNYNNNIMKINNIQMSWD